MALRAREIYYFVRVGNYASRPLRALQSDFTKLGAAGDAAAHRLERLRIEQQRLQRSIATRQMAIPLARQASILRLQQQALAIDKQRITLANRRTTIDSRIAGTESKINQALARGNVLEKERVLLESKLAAASLRQQKGLAVQQASLASQRAQVTRSRALVPRQQTIARLGVAEGRARVAATGAVLGQAAISRRATLAGDISSDPKLARAQAAYIAATRALKNFELAEIKLGNTTKTLAERQQILAASAERLVAVETELKVATQQQALSLERLDAQQLKNTAQVERYREELVAFSGQIQLLVSEEAKLTLAERQLIAARIQSALAIAKQTGMMDAEVAALERVSAAMLEQQAIERRHTWQTWGLRARAVSDFGRTMQYAGAITVFAMAAMAKTAAHFRTQVVLAATQVGDEFGNVGNRIKQTNAIADQLQSGLLRQMKQFPASADEMAKASYDIYSSLTLQGTASDKTAQGLRILRVFQQAAVGGQTKLSEVTNAGITILNQFGDANLSAGKQIDQLRKFMDQAFSAVRFGRTTFSEFTTMLANAAPAAKAANQGFANMAGTLAFLTRRLPVRQASVAYARLLEILQRSEKGLVQHGIAVRDTVTKAYRPLDKIIGDIVRRNPDLVKGRKNIIEFFKEMTKGSGTGTMGTIQARRAFVFLVQQYKQYQGVLKSTTRDQGEFWKSFRALQASPEVKWKIFVNQLHALAIEIGQYAIPALIKMLAPIQKLVQWFEKLDDKTKKQIATLAVWTGGILLIGGTLAVFIGTIGRMVTTFANLGTAMFGTRAAMGGLAAEAGFLTVETAGLFAIAAALLYLYVKYPAQFKKVAGSVFDVKGAFKALEGSINDVKTVIRGLGDLIDVVSTKLKSLHGSANPATTSMNRLWRAARSAYHWLKNLASIKPIKIVITFAFKATGLGGKLGRMLDVIRNPLKGALNAATPGPIKFGLGLLRDTAKIIDKIDPKKINPPLGTNRTDPRIHQAITLAQRNAKEQKKTAVAAAIAQIERNKSAQEWIKLAIKANRYAAAHPKNLAAQTKAYQIMNTIQSKFQGAQLQGIQAVISADTAGTKKRIKNVQTLAKATIDNMKQVYDELLQKNEAAFGSITDGVRAANALEWSGIPRASDLLKDLQDQVKNFMRWRRELDQLRKRGLPANMLAQLQEAGPEKEGILQGILKMTPKQIKQYVALWKRGQQAIRQATAVDFNYQLTQWRSHGRNAAVQFMKGMKDEGSYINKEMRRIFLAWLKGHTGAHLPTGPKKSPPKKDDKPVGGKGGRPTGRGGRGDVAGANRHITIHEGNIHISAKDQDLTTAYRKARLIQRNRRANRLNWSNA